MKEKLLTYTSEMKKQDELWVTEQEDLNIMEELYNQIVNEARSKGFKGIVNMYDGENEKLIEVFESENEKILAQRDCIDVDTYGYCKPLIDKLESILNSEKRG